MINIPKKLTKKFGKDGTIIKHYELNKIYPHIISYKCIETGLIESFSKKDFRTEVDDDIEKEKQKKKILEIIKKDGYITTYNVYNKYRITKLTSKLNELKKEGYKFKESWYKKVNYKGEIYRFKKYSLKKGKNEI